MKTIVLTTILTICLVGAAQASVTFDFEGLAKDSGLAVVDTYMDTTYGSDITLWVSSHDGKLIKDNEALGPDKWLRSDGGGSAEDGIKITFNAVSITSVVSFDWAKDNNKFYADYSYDGVTFYNFFSYTTEAGKANGTVTYDFGSNSVVALHFHDSGAGWVGIDNLVVDKYVASTQPVIPAPGAILLGSIGVSIVGWLRRRRTL